MPADIPDLAGTISLVARITKADPRELLAKCQAARTFCWVARKADAETADRIRAMNLRGIYFQKESKRFYPKRELAAQVLGYVGMDDEGLSGIERADDDELRGKPGRMLISVDARRKWFGSVEKQPDPGENVVLTIDEKIQYIAERELETAMQQTHAESGTVVVQNPKTGEILALANRPTFNPNLAREITPQKLKDHAVSDVYEPGSTFKLVTIAAALEEKLTRPDEVFDCQMGSIVINGMRIRDSKPHGLLPVAGILAESSDVGAIKIALRLGEERFYKYIRAFGFGQQTGIELPGETRGLTKPLNRWSKVSIGAISMGQEIGVTPLQLVAMVSTIANDGVWAAPRIIAGTTATAGHSPDGRVSSRSATPRDLSHDGGPDETDDAGRGPARHREEGNSRRLQLGGKDRHGAESRSCHPCLFAYQVRGDRSPDLLRSTIRRSQSRSFSIPRLACIRADRFPPRFSSELRSKSSNTCTRRTTLNCRPAARCSLAERRVKDQDVEEGSPDRLGDSLEAVDSMPADSSPSQPGLLLSLHPT